MSLDVGGFYVKPEYRNGIHSKNILKDIIKVARDFGCKILTACVVTDFKDPETAMYNMLRMKFKFQRIDGEIIYFYYNLEEV